MESARCCWEVVAGLIPGKNPEPEFTKQWWITSAQWASDDGLALWEKGRDEAYDYAKTLLDPNRLNWVRVDWIWF